MELTILLVCGLFTFTMFGFFLTLRGYLRTWDEYFQDLLTAPAPKPVATSLAYTTPGVAAASPQKKLKHRKVAFRVRPNTNRSTDVFEFLNDLNAVHSPLLTPRTTGPNAGKVDVAKLHKRFLRAHPQISYQGFRGWYLIWRKNSTSKMKAI